MVVMLFLSKYLTYDLKAQQKLKNNLKQTNVKQRQSIIFTELHPFLFPQESFLLI